MAGKSQYAEGKVLDHLFRTDFTAPTNVYVALMTAAPSDTGGGTEVSGGSYARVAVARGTGTWAAPSGTPRQISNVADINFTPNPTADWAPSGTPVVAVALYDSLTTGNLLYWTTTQSDGVTAISKIIQSGDPVKVPAGSLIIRED